MTKLPPKKHLSGRNMGHCKPQTAFGRHPMVDQLCPLYYPGRFTNRLMVPAHVGPKQMMKTLKPWWHPFLSAMVAHFVLTCDICQAHNVRPSLKQLQGTFTPVCGPGEEVVIDFTDMITRVQGKQYLLVIVDYFTGWPEHTPLAGKTALL